MLPLLLGLAGAFFHYKKHQKDFWVVGLLFVLTGLAILVYLNQYPLQPRERDYAYSGSFYAFAIWIGIGVAGLIEWVSKQKKSLCYRRSCGGCITIPGAWDYGQRKLGRSRSFGPLHGPCFCKELPEFLSARRNHVYQWR